MLSVNVNYSVKSNVNECIQEIASNIAKLSNLKLILLYNSNNISSKELLSNAKTAFENKAIIGASTKGIVTKDGIFENDSFIGSYSFSDEDMIVGLASSETDNNPREIGKKIARAAITNAGVKKVPAFFYMVASCGHEEEYLKGIEDVIGTVPFFGGSTSGEIICNDAIIKNGCAVAFFYSKVEIKNIYSGGYDETVNAGVITKINDDRKLLEIDRVSAVEKYSEWLNLEENEKLLEKSVLHPLGVKDPIGSVTRIMKLVDNDDNSITMSNNLALGTAVMQLETTKDGIIESNEEVLKTLKAKMKKNISGYFLIESADRLNVLGDKKNEIYASIKKCVDNKEFMMVLSEGEFGSCDHSANTCGALSMSFTSFSE